MKKLLIAALSLLSLAVSPLRAEPVELSAESRLWLLGDSTLHAWTTTATKFDVKMDVEGAGSRFDAIAGGGMKSLEVRVPVVELKSGKGQLDKNLRKSLKAEEHPEIVFRLEGYEVKASTSAELSMLAARGVLAIAGQSKPVTIEAQLSAGEKTRVKGEYKLLMSDYGVKPPSFMGAIRTRDQVTVHYDLFLK